MINDDIFLNANRDNSITFIVLVIYRTPYKRIVQPLTLSM